MKLKDIWCESRHLWYTVKFILDDVTVLRKYEICWDCGRVIRDGVEVYRP